MANKGKFLHNAPHKPKEVPAGASFKKGVKAGSVPRPRKNTNKVK